MPGDVKGVGRMLGESPNTSPHYHHFAPGSAVMRGGASGPHRRQNLHDSPSRGMHKSRAERGMDGKVSMLYQVGIGWAREDRRLLTVPQVLSTLQLFLFNSNQ